MIIDVVVGHPVVGVRRSMQQIKGDNISEQVCFEVKEKSGAV